MRQISAGVGGSALVCCRATVGTESASVSSRNASPQIDSVTRRLALVSAFIMAFASASPCKLVTDTAPIDSSQRPSGKLACAVTT